jgi:soluble lytic murein transglycosylase
MKNLIKLKVFFLIFFMVITAQSQAGERILPQPKPSVDKEIKETVDKKKNLYPKKKPKILSSVDKNENSDITKNTEEIFIYPKNKPIIVQKKIIKIVEKSKVLSKRDFEVAKNALMYASARKWQTAIKIAKTSRDKSVYNLINYLYLIQPSNSASFYDYKIFIDSNPNFPRINRLKYLAEHKINLKSNKPNSVLKWFDGNMPLSAFGKIKLGEIYILQNKYDEGSNLIKEGWIKAKLSKANLRYLRNKYKKIITVQDNIKRADWHAWEGKHWDVQRMLRYLPKDYTALYRARQILMSQSYGVDNAIKKVPAKFKNDIGLRYDRLKWRRRRGRLDPSLEILFKVPKDPIKLVRPEIWWKERAILTRSLIYKKKYVLAYKVSSSHSLNEGPEYAEAEWLSGWVALTFLNDPNMALEHFKNFYDNVGYPISLSRGAYWMGRTYKKMNNKEKSNEWFNEASKYMNTYYGQLAFVETNPGESFFLEDQPKISEKYQKEFIKNPLIKIVKLLKELEKTKYTKDFVKHLAKLNIDKGSEILAGNLSIEIGRYDFAIQIAKSASYEKRFFNEINYPIIDTPKIVNKKTMPNPELVLAVIRQESEFDQKANSYVGAQGLMQIMTYTGKLLAKKTKMPYSKARLKSDPEYNIKLGSFYLAELLENYEGSYPFALSAYNAGPKRVKYWKKINGNPQNGEINYVDWVELIKFKETRNYVQRVLENVNVYRYILNGRPVKIHNFFEDKPHY